MSIAAVATDVLIFKKAQSPVTLWCRQGLDALRVYTTDILPGWGEKVHPNPRFYDPGCCGHNPPGRVVAPAR